MKHEYPIYPSVAVLVDPDHYMAAAQALQGVSDAYFDGVTILVPESDTYAIELLKEHFHASSFVYGQAKEYEFSTKAYRAGVPKQLVRLGQSVHSSTGLSAEEMVTFAIEHECDALLVWDQLYRSSMDPHYQQTTKELK